MLGIWVGTGRMRTISDEVSEEMPHRTEKNFKADHRLRRWKVEGIIWGSCQMADFDINIPIKILDIVHRRVFYLKRDISEIEICLRP